MQFPSEVAALVAAWDVLPAVMKRRGIDDGGLRYGFGRGPTRRVDLGPTHFTLGVGRCWVYRGPIFGRGKLVSVPIVETSKDNHDSIWADDRSCECDWKEWCVCVAWPLYCTIIHGCQQRYCVFPSCKFEARCRLTLGSTVCST